MRREVGGVERRWRGKREAVRGPLAPSSGKQESPDLKQLSAESSIVNRGGGITAVKMMVVKMMVV